MAVVIEKDSDGEFHFVDDLTDMHKNLINEARDAEGNYSIVSAGNEDIDPSETCDKNELETNDKIMNVAVNTNIGMINEADNRDAELHDVYNGIQLNKKTVSKIMALLERSIGDICTEAEYKVVCLIEEQLQKEAEKKTSGNANSVEVIDYQDDGTIYFNMQQLFKYFNNTPEECSLSNPLWVPRCAYWDDHLQDVVVHNTDKGEPSKDTNSST